MIGKVCPSRRVSGYKMVFCPERTSTMEYICTPYLVFFPELINAFNLVLPGVSAKSFLLLLVQTRKLRKKKEEDEGKKFRIELVYSSLHIESTHKKKKEKRSVHV